jgi:hypothetical protein
MPLSIVDMKLSIDILLQRASSQQEAITVRESEIAHWENLINTTREEIDLRNEEIASINLAIKKLKAA